MPVARSESNGAPPASEAGRAAGTTDELTPDRHAPEPEGRSARSDDKDSGRSTPNLTDSGQLGKAGAKPS